MGTTFTRTLTTEGFGQIFEHGEVEIETRDGEAAVKGEIHLATSESSDRDAEAFCDELEDLIREYSI